MNDISTYGSFPLRSQDGSTFSSYGLWNLKSEEEKNPRQMRFITTSISTHTQKNQSDKTKQTKSDL